jgi:hypothetical protein
MMWRSLSISPWTQAFILLLGADIAVGYHSSDGWQALLCCLVTHYGMDYENFEMFARIFTATVPVRPDNTRPLFSPTSSRIVLDGAVQVGTRSAGVDSAWFQLFKYEF